VREEGDVSSGKEGRNGGRVFVLFRVLNLWIHLIFVGMDWRGEVLVKLGGYRVESKVVNSVPFRPEWSIKTYTSMTIYILNQPWMLIYTILSPLLLSQQLIPLPMSW
jgi:hypothetical protein